MARWRPSIRRLVSAVRLVAKALPGIVLLYAVLAVIYEAAFAAWFVSPLVEDWIEDAIDILDDWF